MYKMERNYKIGIASEVKHSASKPPKDIQLARLATTKNHEDAQTDGHIKESISKTFAAADPTANAANPAASAILSNW